MTAVARTEPITGTVVTAEEPKGVRALLRQAVDRWAPFVPKGVDPEEVVQACYLETKKNPELLKCDGESILQAVTRIQRLGLTIGVTAYLIPFGKECTAVIGKDGVIELIISTGVVRSVRARCIYKNEPYRFVAGTQMSVEHQPINDPDTRGALMGAYVIFRLAHGDMDAFEMSAKEIDAIRQRYSRQWKKGPLPDWYCEKTVIIHGAKQLPKNPRMARLTAITARISDRDDLLEGDDTLALAERPMRYALSAPSPTTEPIGTQPINGGGYEETPRATDAASRAVPSVPTVGDASDAPAEAPAACKRCGQPHRFDGGEDLGNAAGSCFKYTPAS